MHKAHILFLGMCLLAVQTLGQEQPRIIIESPQQAEYDTKTRLAYGTNITIRYQDVTLTANKASWNEETGEVVAEGGVRLEGQGQLWAGEELHYNLKTRRFVGKKFRTGQSPFFVQGDMMAGDLKESVYVTDRSFVTTDDYADPGYRIRARRIIFVPGEFIMAQHAMLYLGDVPVFYFPLYRRSLKAHRNFFVHTPGYRSADGPFLLTSYNWFWNEQLDGAVNIDLRAKRGIGFGPDFNWHLPRFGEGTFSFYYINDQDPNGERVVAPILNDDRKRLSFSHQANPITNMSVKVQVNYQSDQRIIRDFFESEYRKDPQPDSFAEVDYIWPNFSIDVLARKQINDFFETVERLPDLRLTGYRQQLGDTPFFYESESSLGYFKREFNSSATNLPYAAARGDTFHQVLWPQTYFGWLNITPRVGGRFTHYGEAHDEGGFTDEHERGVFNTGAELSFKASRLWPQAASKFWEIDGVRHIVQPTLNYVYVPRPTVPAARLPQFDYELPSTRLLPIDFPDYNSIDSIDTYNVLRMGLRNRLQTKRRGQVDNLINWALYTDWRLQRRENQGSFADIYSDLAMRPFSWLFLYSEVRYNVESKLLREANHSATISPGDTWSFAVGHRYLRDDPVFGPNSGNNLIFGTLYYKFNENWGTRIHHRYEARDGTLEEQYYSVYRDFRSWTAALTLRLRDNRTAGTDWTIALTASMKAFPRFELGEDTARPSKLFGR